MPTGTSVIGMQRLYQNAASPTNGFTLDIDGSAFVPPYRVGFGYLIYHDVTTGTNGTVAWSGVIYRPGMAMYLPRKVGNSGDKTALWVDWNIEGLSWTSNPIN
jgi:hypothetical protein